MEDLTLAPRLEHMSALTYLVTHAHVDKPVVWLHGAVKTPPFSAAARLEAGCLLRRLQRGESLALPQSRPMPAIGARCHELRINDERSTWRIMCRTDADAVLILEVFEKKTRTTPQQVLRVCRDRLRMYDDETE